MCVVIVSENSSIASYCYPRRCPNTSLTNAQERASASDAVERLDTILYNEIGDLVVGPGRNEEDGVVS